MSNIPRNAWSSRGLRWDVHPQQGDSDLEPFFRYFNEVGIIFLNFLVDKKQLRLTIIEKEIKDLKDKLTPYKTTSEYISLSTNLRNPLEKEEREPRTKKQKQYNPNVNDYETNLVFSLQKKGYCAYWYGRKASLNGGLRSCITGYR